MESFTYNLTQAEICRRHGIYPVPLSTWREQFILGGKSALAPKRNTDSRDKEIQDLKKIIGDQSLVIVAFKNPISMIFCNMSSSRFLHRSSTLFSISRNPVLPSIYLTIYILDSCNRNSFTERLFVSSWRLMIASME